MRQTFWIGALALLAAVASGASAQDAPTDTLSLPAVRVEAARGAGSVATAPFSVAVQERGTVERLTDPSTSLARSLRLVPGLNLTDRQNPALGERVVVRGLGYRSAFGVRGVQVVQDGVPLTLADGQAVLTTVDPSFVRRAEIVRGPASALWGNGSGGVLFLSTLPDDDAPPVSARFAGGAYGLARAEAEAVGTTGAVRAGLALSHTETDGYRDYSALRTTRGRAFADIGLSDDASLLLTAAGDVSPRQQHPGALTLDELAADRRQPQSRYVDTQSGKDSAQGQVAATLRAASGLGDLTATVYGIGRRLRNPLPFAYIRVDRAAGGTRLALERDLGAARWTVGADAAVQHDDRQNLPNVDGEPQGDPSLDQLETVTQGALWTRLRLDLAGLGLPGAAVEGALRGDRVHFSSDDRLLGNGDQSGSRTLGAVSPQVGVSYRTGSALLFASLATAFETPTTTELVNRPDGAGGFNPDLEPQRTVGVEAGARGVAGRLRYDAAVYALAVRDGLAPFEGEDGRTYYVNRGRTNHRGVELLAEWQPTERLGLGATYTWSDFRFDGDAFEGNRLPGVPEHRLAVQATVEHASFALQPEAEAASGVWTDDANTVQTDAFVVVDVALAYTGWSAGSARLRPFVRVQNVLGADYVASVVINANGGRFYEPAAGRAVQAGLGVSL